MIWRPGTSPFLFRKPGAGGGSSVPVPTVYWEADSGIVTTTNGTTADASPVSGNKVLSWTSKDSSATVASYATNSQRPTYYAPSWGKPYVTFDGTASNRLETTAFNSTFNGAAQYTFGISFRKAAAYSGYRNETLMAFNTSGVHGMINAGPGGSGYAMFGGGSSRVYMAYSGELSGECTLFGSFSTTGTSSTAGSSITKMYFNGVLVQSDTTTTATTNISDRITLGGTQDPTNSRTKDIYGFYLYNTQLTDAQVLTVNNDIKSRLFTLALPVSGAALWLDGSQQWNLFDTTALANNLYSNGGAIGQWNDQSGNALNSQQTNSASRPTWATPGSGINGLGTIAFNGSQWFAIADNAALKISSGMTCFAVVKFTNWGSSTHQTLIEKGPHASGLNYLFGKSNTNVMKFTYNDGSFRDVFESSAYSGGTVANQLSWRVNKSATPKTVNFRANGSLKSTVTDANNLSYSSTTTTGARIGTNGSTGESFSGQIAEMIMFSSELSDANIATIESYLKAKWGTP